MNKITKRKLRKRIKKIEKGIVTEDIIVYILHELRDSLSVENPIRELGNFIHLCRDRGEPHGLVSKTFKNIVKVSNADTNKFKVEHFLTYSELINEFIEAVNDLGIKINKNKIKENKEEICVKVIDYLHGKEIKVNIHEHIEDIVSLEKFSDGNKPMLIAKMKPKRNFGKRIKMKKGVALSIPIIEPN